MIAGYIFSCCDCIDRSKKHSQHLFEKYNIKIKTELFCKNIEKGWMEGNMKSARTILSMII